MTIARRPIASIEQVDGLQGALDGKEAALGNPASSGLVLASTTAGVRSWVDAPRERVIASVSARSTNHPASWSADAGTDVLTSSVAHGLTVNTPIAFGAGTGALPGGLAAEPEYYWVIAAPTTTTLQVSLTFGGAAVDITSAGTAGWVVRNLPLFGPPALATSGFSLKSLGAIDVTFALMPARKYSNGFYPLIVLEPSTCQGYISYANALPQGGYRFAMFTALAMTKKYTRVTGRIRLQMVSDTTAAGLFTYAALGADDAAFTSGLAYLNSTFGLHITTPTDITGLTLSDGYGGYMLAGSSMQVVSAAR